MLDLARPLRIAAEFEPFVPMVQRRSNRAPVSFDAKLGRGGLDRALCRVIDLSMHGGKVQTYSPLRKDSLIWLTLPGAGPRIASIRWAGDFEAGCEFEEPIPREIFDSLVEA